jgi:hypothetical protein
VSKVAYLHLRGASQLIRGVGPTLEPTSVREGATDFGLSAWPSPSAYVGAAARARTCEP